MTTDAPAPTGLPGDEDREAGRGPDRSGGSGLLGSVLKRRRSSEGRMPPLDGATGWLNSPPLSPPELRGKVVAVQFWTYTCINWLRTLAAVRAWDAAYGDHGLVVIGVHSPEFSFERDLANVRREVLNRAITYPVALDNDFAVWDGFANHFWPALYLVDAGGSIRLHHFGESDYDDAERVLRDLLVDAGTGSLPEAPLPVPGSGVEIAADWDSLRSPETYLGYARTGRFASPGGPRPGLQHRYTVPPRMRLGEWALSGEWTMQPEAAVGSAENGRISCAFQARDVHIVMGPGAGPVRFRVLIDGRPPGRDHGEDVDATGAGTASEPRLHNLLRQAGSVDESTIEVEFLDPGIHLYSLTFG
jgi:thiol-disulfide isomerase/thioredoxin